LLNKIKYISLILLFSVVYFISTSVTAEIYGKNSKIALPSCEVSIIADEYSVNHKGITYSGNVKVLIGFANLRIDKVTLVKKKDGKCELIPA